MPERRARMLSFAETAIVSVPVVAPSTWMSEPAETVVAAAPVPLPRFMSEDEEEAEQQIMASRGRVLVSPASTTSRRIAMPTPQVEVAVAPPAPAATISVAEPEAVEVQEQSAAAVEPEQDLVPEPYRPRFAELAEEPPFTPLPRDFASDFPAGFRGAPDGQRGSSPASLFNDEEESHADLERPAFMRRAKF
jgi:hypothetical protein